MDGFLKELREANKERQKIWSPVKGTPLSFKGLELAGEVGELCNALKKIERTRLGIRGGTSDLRNAYEEIGDVLVCLDLIAEYLDIDIEKATRMKFNQTSEEQGIDVFLPT